MRANPVTSISLSDCRIPMANLLGTEGQGLKIALTGLNTGRIGIAAQAVGIAQGAFDVSIKYAKERVQFKVPIARHQGVQMKLADMSMLVEAARLLTYRAAYKKDKGEPLPGPSAMAKLFAGEAAMSITNQAIQVHGGYGYTKEYPVERFFRDAKITEIYEGTSEMQRMTISKELLKEAK